MVAKCLSGRIDADQITLGSGRPNCGRAGLPSFGVPARIANLESRLARLNSASDPKWLSENASLGTTKGRFCIATNGRIKFRIGHHPPPVACGAGADQDDTGSDGVVDPDIRMALPDATLTREADDLDPVRVLSHRIFLELGKLARRLVDRITRHAVGQLTDR